MNNRQSIRLDGYDYGKNGYYFVTVDTWRKRKLFGEIIGGIMILNQNGIILNNEIMNTPKMRLGVKIPVHQIMPDHWHAIIFIPHVGAGCFPPDGVDGNPTVNKCKKQNLGNIIGGIKMAVTKKLKLNEIKFDIWQRDYYERIIRNEIELKNVSKYIIENPIKWKK